MVSRRRLSLIGMGIAAVAATSVVAPTASAAPLPRGCTQAPFQATVRCVFTYTGTPQTFVVPRGVKNVLVNATGARGGGITRQTPTVASRIIAYIPARGGQRLYVYVGGAGQTSQRYGGTGAGGYNGGASGHPAGGGGASDVRTVGGNPMSLASLRSRLIVAGGAGGSVTAIGGSGGRTGESNSNIGGGAFGGGPGGQANGGTASGDAQPGRFGVGGASSARGAGGGGGGGWFGGGGGYRDGGGGGGSSFPAIPSPIFTSTGAQVTIIYTGACFPFCFGS